MSTVIRSEISKNNPYYISKHRYYELKHFCLQYKDFKRIYNDLCEKIPGGIVLQNGLTNDFKINKKLYIREKYLNKINLIEECSQLTDEILGPYILKGVTENLTYSYFKMNSNIPCCRDIYYEHYRKFFFILSHKKDFA